MLPQIKKRIKESKRLYFYANLIRYWRTEEFRNYIRGFNGPDVAFIHHLGKLYPELLVYDINIKSDAGFFAIIQWILLSLYYAERFYLTPVVRWTESRCYKEEKLINGTDNIFEYYFLPVSEVSVSDIAKCKNVVNAAGSQRTAIFGGTLVSDVYLYRRNMELTGKYGELYQKYFRLNARVKDYIDENISKVISGKKVIGVHVRGTDFKINANNHPVCIGAEDFIKPMKKIMKKHRYGEVFLATDSIEAVDVFKKEFGEKLLFYEDITRSDADVGIHFMKSDRKYHHYRLGLEVLRDAYTLAACDSLVAGMSNVSLAAQYIKVAQHEEYRDILIMDYGINSYGKKR